VVKGGGFMWTYTEHSVSKLSESGESKLQCAAHLKVVSEG
jgi:hypothetical protein